MDSLQSRLVSPGGAFEEGATAAEYAIMVGLIAVVIIVAVGGVGQTLLEMYNCTAAAVDALPGLDECVK